MNTSLYTSAVSMNAVQQKLDVIARNVANVNTYGYKRSEASFEDLLTSVIRQHRQYQLPGRATPPGFVLGNGVRVDEVLMTHKQGPLSQTDNPLDLAISGDAFFEVEINEDPVQNAAGETVPRAGYTRDGAFKLSQNPANPSNNFLTNQFGRFVRDVNDQRIEIPTNARRIIIDDQGNVTVQLPDNSLTNVLAQIKMVRVANPQDLENVGDNMFVLPKNFGVNNPAYVKTVEFNNPNANPSVIEQGYLEQSNVNLSQEMSELIANQRAFQLLARSLSTTDTMMGLVNSLRA